MDLAPGAWRWAALPLGAAAVALLVAPPLSVALAVLGVGVLWFHRDPDREIAPAGVVAPADGRVTEVREEGDRVRVAVFLNVTDVHVCRAPVDATVEGVEREPGGHWPAFTKAAERNERVRFDLGATEVTLTAGTVARRVHPYVSGGEVDRGERIAHISFGSRADVVLPPEYDREDLTVAEGDRVRAGETAVAL